MIELLSYPTIDRVSIDWACSQIREPISEIVLVRSGDESTVYKFCGQTNRWFLKIGFNLGQEKDCLRWLSGHLRVPTVIGFHPTMEADALLMTGLDGYDLAHWCRIWPSSDVVRRFADALRAFNRTDLSDYEFDSPPTGASLIHGDACLPNILFLADGSLSGFVDVGNLHAGDVADDLSAAVWSLNYNLGPSFGLPFLQRYGVEDATAEMVAKLCARYIATTSD